MEGSSVPQINKTEMVLESSKGNYNQVLPSQGFASVTFPMFHLSKLSQSGETKSMPVIKFNNVANVYVPEVLDQKLSSNPFNVQKNLNFAQGELTEEQQAISKSQNEVLTPLFLYGLNTHDPVQIIMDTETHKFKQIKMKLIFEVNGVKKEPLEFYIVADLKSENCKTGLSAQSAEQEDSDEEESTN
jgi:hypothetical protein